MGGKGRGETIWFGVGGWLVIDGGVGCGEVAEGVEVDVGENMYGSLARLRC